MSTCKEFKEIILTDYIDGELDQTTKGQLEGHLHVCAQCREFSDEVKAQLVAPFKGAPRAAVPADLWRSIEESIAQENEEMQPAASWSDRFIQSLALPRLAPVVLSFILFVLVGLWVFNRQAPQTVNNDSGEYAAYVMDSVNELAETGSDVLGTSIEQYFL